MVYPKNRDGSYWVIFLIGFLTACGTDLSGAILGAVSENVDIDWSDDAEDEAIPNQVADVIEEDAVEVFEATDLESSNQANDEDSDTDTDLEGGTPSGPVAFPVTWPKEGDDCIPDDTELMAVSYDGGGQTTYFFMPDDGQNHRFHLNGEITTLVCKYVQDDDAYIWIPDTIFEGDFIVTVRSQEKKQLKITTVNWF